MPPVVASRPDPNQTYVNIAIVNLDPQTGEMTLAVSGNRYCETPCSAVSITLYALDDNPAQRRGLGSAGRPRPGS